MEISANHECNLSYDDGDVADDNAYLTTTKRIINKSLFKRAKLYKALMLFYCFT